MKTAIAVAVAAVALSSYGSMAAPVEKRLFMAISLDAQPSLPAAPSLPTPALNLGDLVPSPPPAVEGLVSTITSVIGDLTTLIPTTIPTALPTPTLPIAIPTETPDVSNVIGALVQNAMKAFPSILLENLSNVQQMVDSATAAAAAAAAHATEVTYTDELGKICTKTITPEAVAVPTEGVINPLTLVPSPLPTNAEGVVSVVTSIIDGVTKVLPAPPALPTDMLPLLSGMQLPSADLPGLLGNKQDACLKDSSGNMIGSCGDGLVLKDAETISI
ncbi:hypothetical protein BCV70DRAFT_84286 [Testicularia cyperi]|uniref:Cell wall protein n=1 Tax=Testicularia cyperi TaxID=1882483 RepID=A0A317XRK9_9BASI|nr:hypothetical protein BCV70DRAFT_84286 [Testicularia cyperi]